MKTRKKIRELALILALMLFMSIIPNVTMSNAASVKLNTTKKTLYTGFSTTLKITGTSAKVTWSSSDKKVATVTSSGKVTAVKKGSCTITAKVNKKSYKCAITVKEEKLNKTSLSLNKGSSATLSLASGEEKSFSTSSKSIATVTSSGKVTAKKKGTATITCVSKNGKKYTCKVTVKETKDNNNSNNNSNNNKNDDKDDDSSNDSSSSSKNCSHKYGDVIVDEAATCKATGKGHKVCSKCKKTVSVTIQKASHTYVDSYKDYSDNCCFVHTCSVCGYEYKTYQPYGDITLAYEDENYKLEKTVHTNHTYGNGVPTSDGITFTCIYCKRANTYKPTCKHTKTTVKTEDYNQREDGSANWVEKTICDNCGKCIKTEYKDKECEHDYSISKETYEDAWCEHGKTLCVEFKCSKCGKTHTMRAWDQMTGANRLIETGTHATGYFYRKWDSYLDIENHRQWVECGKQYVDSTIEKGLEYDFEAIYKKEKGYTVESFVKNNYPASIIHEYDILDYSLPPTKEMFWSNYNCSAKCRLCGKELTKHQSLRIAYIGELKNILNHIIKPGMTDIEKATAVYDFMAYNFDYDYDAANELYRYTQRASLFGGVIWDGKGICGDFTEIYSDFMTMLGIECVYVYAGNATHVYDAVYINNKWLFVDVTAGVGAVEAGELNGGTITYVNGEFYCTDNEGTFNYSDYVRDYCLTEYDNWNKKTRYDGSENEVKVETTLYSTEYAERCKIEEDKWCNQLKEFGYSWFND